MSEYGQIINPQYDPSKNIIYESFCDYFGNPILTKIKDVESFSVYMSRIYTMIGNSYRYLILFIKKDINRVGFTQSMKTAEWISLQTRTLEDIHDLKPHKYQAKITGELSQKVNIKSRDEKQSVYESEKFKLFITLLHTRKNFTYQYQNTGTIISCLETYQTIINFSN